MKNYGQKSSNGAFSTFSSYLRMVSNGASTVASTVRSAIVDRESDPGHDQVLWAGFDKLEWDGGISHHVLLLAYRSGFQVWDIEEADNVFNLVSRLDGTVSFAQMLPKPVASKRTGDKYAEYRPLLAVCADSSFSGGRNAPGPISTPCSRTTPNFNDPLSSAFMATVVWFYSLRSRSYVHVLKFRSAIYSVRCSTRVVAIAQAAQIHCLDAATLEKEYTILTNPIGTGCSAFGGIGYGPLAVGPRWLAYSGSLVAVSISGRVNPQNFAPSPCFPSASNGSLVAYYAKESSKQLAAGIVTLGDMGYKKLSRYYSELVPDNHNSSHLGWKPNGTINGHSPDAENDGMVIVRDIVSKSIIAQFRAHKSPISSLCFDPSGTLLVTASVQGHNINVFRVMPGLAANSSASDSSPSFIHLYTLQRGVTNAVRPEVAFLFFRFDFVTFPPLPFFKVIQDISFSNDSHWIMISSTRGTNHLFAISPYGGPVHCLRQDGGPAVMAKPAIRRPPNSTSKILNQQNLYASGPPLSLSAVTRIGNNSWRSTIDGAAAAATGRTSSFYGAIASVFHNCNVNELHENTMSSETKYHLLVFSSGCMEQHVLRASLGKEIAVRSGPGSYGYASNSDVGLVVNATQKWEICRKQIHWEREDNSDIYGENGNSDRSKVFAEQIEESNGRFLKGRCLDGKAKISSSKKHPIFISEAELQMHEAQIPLWAKIYFQCMTDDGGSANKSDHGGEIEIERIPTHVIEARPKNLVPVFDCLQSSKFQPSRISDLDDTANRQLVHQTSGLYENGRLSSRCSASSLDSMADGGTLATELHSGIEDATTGRESLHIPIDTMKGFVNSSNHGPKTSTRLDFVNNRGSSMMEAQIKLVNNNIEGHIMDSHMQDGCIEFD